MSRRDGRVPAQVVSLLLWAAVIACCVWLVTKVLAVST